MGDRDAPAAMVTQSGNGCLVGVYDFYGYAFKVSRRRANLWP